MVIKNIIKFLKFILLNEAYKFESKKSIRIRMRGYFKFYSNKKKRKYTTKDQKEITKHKLKSVLKENKLLLNLFLEIKKLIKSC